MSGAIVNPHPSPQFPYTWPDGAWACITPMVVLEVWSDEQNPGANIPAGFLTGNSPIPAGTTDRRVQMLIEYGGRVGIWRLLDLLVQEDVPASVIATGRAVELYPEVMRSFAERGDEIIGHSYLQDVGSYAFDDDPEAERANIVKSVEVIERVTGTRPTGWISPRATPSRHTDRLLAEEGFVWCGDYPNDELPYVVEHDGRPFVRVPYSGTAGVNDYDVSVIQSNPAQVYVDEFKRTIEHLHEEHKRTGRPAVIRFAAHAHVFGRPWGRHAYLEAIRYAKSVPGAWIATRGQLAQRVLDEYQARRPAVADAGE